MKHEGRYQQRKGGKRKLRENGGGQRDLLAVEAETGLDVLFPKVVVALKGARQELTHLRVKPVDVGGQR